MNNNQMINLLTILLGIMIGILVILCIVFLVLKVKSNKPKPKQKQEKKKEISKKEDRIAIQTYNKESIFKFMEFDKIDDNMIIQKDGKRFLMVIECQGINYDLMSGLEKNSV